MKYLTNCFLFYCILTTVSCGNKKKEEHAFENFSKRVIDLRQTDIIENEIDDILELESYVILSNEIPLGKEKRVIIDKGKIFVLDNEPKVVCFDMQGKILYKVDSRGPGPEEYDHIDDICIDNVSNKLIAFDSHKMKLFFYNLKTGKYVSNISTRYMDPTEFGISKGTFFFKKIDHNRFHTQKEMQFYLLYSENGEKIDKMFLPHDAVADYGFDMESFFYNDNQLLFVKPFDKTIYFLDPGQITPLYEILLPNQLPMRKIEEKMDYWELLKSEYSWGLGDIYLANNILHFIFSKNGFIVSAYYDLSTDKFLYCGTRVLRDAREKFPFYSLIKGVYDGKFFSLISPSQIIEGREKHPEFFSQELLDIKDDDNPVFAFFKLNK
jgi:hypothetical protein